MNLDPGDELALIVDTARRFGRDMLVPSMRDSEASRSTPADTRAAYHEIGLGDLELPEEAGGTGLGSLARVLVNEELGAADAGAAIALDPLGPALYPILEMGGDVSQLMNKIGVDPTATGDRCVLVTGLDGDFTIAQNRVSGICPWLPASKVSSLVVFAGDHAALIRNGFSIQSIRGAGLRAAGAGELRIKDAIPKFVLTHTAGAIRAMARTRLYVASLLLGVMRAACDFSREYAKERQAFGKPIAHHQALAFLMTDMQMALDGCRLLVRDAAWRLDSGRPAEAASASALAECIESSRLIGPNGVQILGGHGFMADYPVEKHMRESRALGLLFGGYDAAVETAGQRVCETDSPLELGLGAAI